MPDSSRNVSTPRLIAGVLGNLGLYFVALFAPIATLHAWRGWGLLAVMGIANGIGTWRVARVHRSLLAERARLPIQRGQPLSDKLLLSCLMASIAGLVAFSSFDGFRAHLLPAPPLSLSIVALAVYAAGSVIVFGALRANAYAALVVRHQSERSQAVVNEGPYRVVRHPMYAGLVVQIIALPLWLGSLAGLLAASLPCALLVVRIVFEERFLRSELPGYSTYAESVRHRLVPGVW